MFNFNFSMVEDTLANVNKSDIYYVNDNALDGTNVSATPIITANESKVKDGLFQAYILVAASVEAKFQGRFDAASGYWGASYHLTGTNVDTFDNNVMDFNYVDNTINSLKTSLYEGIKIVYFPQDNSFSEFKIPSENSTGNKISMSHRMNVYGRGLPKDTVSPGSVIIEVKKVFACLPKPGLEDVLPLHRNSQEIKGEDMDITNDFIKQTGLAIRRSYGKDDTKINNFIDMFKDEKINLLDELRNTNQSEKRELVSTELAVYKPKDIVVKLK